MTQQEANSRFTDNQYIYLYDGTRVDTNAFVCKMSSALSKLSEDDSPYRRMIPKGLTMLYVYNDKRVSTACVDGNNIFISVNYVYSVLKMKDELIYALLSNALEHLNSSGIAEERGYLSKGMPRGLWHNLLQTGNLVQLTFPLHHTLNIASEMKANNNVLVSGIIPIDILKEQMNAVVLEEHNGLLLGNYHHMAELMDKWRDRVGKTFPFNPDCKEEPKTFNSGYKHAMREILRRLEEDGIKEALKCHDAIDSSYNK